MLRLTDHRDPLSHPACVTRSISLPLPTHQAVDLAVVAALGGGGVGLGLAGDPAAGLLLATIGALQLVLLTLTRWARR